MMARRHPAACLLLGFFKSSAKLIARVDTYEVLGLKLFWRPETKR